MDSPETRQQSGCSHPTGSVEIQTKVTPSSAKRDDIISPNVLEHNSHGCTNTNVTEGAKLSSKKSLSTDKCQEGCCGPEKVVEAKTVTAGMPNEDTCCSPSSTEQTTAPLSMNEADKNGNHAGQPEASCHKACCSSEGTASGMMDKQMTRDCDGPHSGLANNSTYEDDECCTVKVVPTKAEQSAEKCCGSQNIEPGQPGCEQTLRGGEKSCSQKPGSTQESDVPPCCKGKRNPCCDSEYSHHTLREMARH